MYVLNRKVDAIIVVSNYLKHFYRDANPMVLPMIFSKNQEFSLTETHEFIELAYAGIPFRLGKKLRDRKSAKDRLDIVLVMLYELDKRSIPFKFDIYGVTRSQYLTVLPEDRKILDALGEKVIFHGFTSNIELIKKIRIADFTVLFRDDNRVTLSGFPTKFSESIKCCTPVIATDTGDIKCYLEEGVTGYIVDINHMEKALSKFESIINSKSESIVQLKKELSVIQKTRYQTLDSKDG